jgi:hypothetical protein
MRIFACQHCGQPLFFENVRCEGCGRRLGYLPELAQLSALETAEDDADNGKKRWRALADATARRYRFCVNAAHDTCNWLVEAGTADQFCVACRHNRTIPDLSVARNALLWSRIEFAKHRLFYTLMRLRLPLDTRNEQVGGLAFDFVSSDTGQVLTGHSSGLITINLTEADDAERERQRDVMREPYRTLLGHFRHEVAHFYWDRLVRDEETVLMLFRELFGDERQDYQAALQNHYANGAPADWPDHYVSAYASAHPWEDFAETWAHYLHMVDTLETARAFGMTVRPKLANNASLSVAIEFDPHEADFPDLIDAWLPMTFAFNAINRSMGLPDLYPFVLSPAVIVKLTFIRNLVRLASGHKAGDDKALHAIVAGLKRKVGVA